jgi:hypothetical protein
VTRREVRADNVVETGLQALEWLLRIQTDPQGHFVPIGNAWCPSSSAPAGTSGRRSASRSTKD